ncbi:flagellin [Desulfospira joergensenii]|uniref:flagellin N-terminal helical domain-containing protein n=1 Tax=Desulfospira joergensenii TaxID=53329 RepID=UPI0003B5714D|nr:flagellin [Desulfospira joergensenii]
MALRINTNVSALNAHKNMIKTDNALSTSLERLSSGLRINKAADDASGMSIADSLRSQGMGLGQAIKNANDGINIVQTADAALDESINIVNTIKTKSIQAAQDGQTTESRAAIQADIDKLMEELDTIARTTSFNGQKLLSGQFTDKRFQIGAYSGETVNISIASSESNKIGHVTTGTLSLAGNKAGTVELAIYSMLQDENYQIEATDVKYNNSRENSMAAVADAINKLTDVLGITAQADVKSTTASTVGAGTLSEFSINGIVMNGVNVKDNDSDGSLVKAINAKTSQHGVLATVAGGFLTLKSSDGRAIEVKADDAGLASVFKGQDMSTIGEIKLNQAGSNDIIITNVNGGDVVTLTNKMDIGASEEFTSSSMAEVGSKLARNSILGGGWNTNQDIVASVAFTDDIVTTQDSTVAANSVLGADSIIEFQGTIFGDVTAKATTGSTTAVGSAGVYSSLKTNSVLGAGSVIGNGTALGGETVVEATGTTTAEGDIKSGSALAAGTVLAKDTILVGTDVSIEQTDITVSDSDIKADSTLAAGSVLGKSTDLGGNNGIIVETTEATESDSTLGASGTILKTGTILGNGTTTAENQATEILQTGELTATSSLISGTVIGAGTLLKAGTYLSSGQIITDVDGTTTFGVVGSGVYLSQDVVLLNSVTTSGNGIDAAANSTLANGTTLASGSTVYADITLAADQTLSGTTDITAKVGTILAGGTTLGSGSTIGIDITLRSAATLSADVTAKQGSMLADGTSLKADSQIAADITLKNNTVTSGAGIAAKTGSSYAEGTIFAAGSDVKTELTLAKASTLTADMDNIQKEITLGTGSILAATSILREGSVFHGNLQLTGNLNVKKDQDFGAGSTIELTSTFIKAGSTIGGDAQLKQDMDVIKDAFTLGIGTRLANRSMLSNGSTFGGTVTLSDDEKIAAGTQMKLEKGSTLAAGSVIAAGTYLTTDITADNGMVYEAGQELDEAITTGGSNVLAEAMTLKGGSVIADGSKLTANAGSNSAAAELTDSETNRFSDVDVLTQESAQIAIAVADATLKDLDKIRADLGSVQNQLSSTIANISTTRVNVFSAESTIRDVDFAEESSNFTKMQILSQAGTFAMSQANASSQNVLSLLQ